MNVQDELNTKDLSALIERVEALEKRVEVLEGCKEEEELKLEPEDFTQVADLLPEFNDDIVPDEIEATENVFESIQQPKQSFNLCPNCGREFKPGSNFCGGCGAKLI